MLERSFVKDFYICAKCDNAIGAVVSSPKTLDNSYGWLKMVINFIDLHRECEIEL